MFEIQQTAGLVVAEDSKSTLVAIDRAILAETRLTSSIIEASEQSGLPIGHSQKLLEGMSRGFQHLVAGRADMLAVIRHLTAIKSASSLDTVDFGCPEGVNPRVPAPTHARHAPADADMPAR